jgi:chromosome partitioning protein
LQNARFSAEKSTMIRTVFNRKGGVGKSSIACNLAAVSASRGHKTLLVDLDTQSNATSYLGHNGRDDTAGITEFFYSQISFSYSDFKPNDYVRSTAFDNLFLISSDQALKNIEQQLESRHKIYKLRDFLRELEQDYEHIFVDTPPALNFFSLSALIAADRCLIPFDCDAFSRDALLDLQHTIAEVREDHNPQLDIEGVIINQFLPRARLPQAAVQELENSAFRILQPYLSSSVVMKESHAANKPLVSFAPRHKLTGQVIELFEHLG